MKFLSRSNRAIQNAIHAQRAIFGPAEASEILVRDEVRALITRTGPELHPTAAIIAQRMVGQPIPWLAEDLVQQVLDAAGPLITLNDPSES